MNEQILPVEIPVLTPNTPENTLKLAGVVEKQDINAISPGAVVGNLRTVVDFLGKEDLEGLTPRQLKELQLDLAVRIEGPVQVSMLARNRKSPIEAAQQSLGNLADTLERHHHVGYIHLKPLSLAVDTQKKLQGLLAKRRGQTPKPVSIVGVEIQKGDLVLRLSDRRIIGLEELRQTPQHEAQNLEAIYALTLQEPDPDRQTKMAEVLQRETASALRLVEDIRQRERIERLMEAIAQTQQRLQTPPLKVGPSLQVLRYEDGTFDLPTSGLEGPRSAPQREADQATARRWVKEGGVQIVDAGTRYGKPIEPKQTYPVQVSAERQKEIDALTKIYPFFS